MRGSGGEASRKIFGATPFTLAQNASPNIMLAISDKEILIFRDSYSIIRNAKKKFEETSFTLAQKVSPDSIFRSHYNYSNQRSTTKCHHVILQQYVISSQHSRKNCPKSPMYENVEDDSKQTTTVLKCWMKYLSTNRRNKQHHPVSITDGMIRFHDV